MRKFLAVTLFVALAGTARAADDPKQPLPVPPTRPEMKQYLEDLKDRTPRIPLPELTPGEKARLGERGSGYEARLRALYLPAGEQGGGFSHEPDPNMSLSYQLKTMLFWIVSRANNCHY